MEVNHDAAPSARYALVADGRLYGFGLTWDEPNSVWRRPLDGAVSNFEDYASYPISPSPETMAHAKKVYETSREFVGRAVLLPKEQLYWYETERESARRRGSLAIFLTNYCSTPEEKIGRAHV